MSLTIRQKLTGTVFINRAFKVDAYKGAVIKQVNSNGIEGAPSKVVSTSQFVLGTGIRFDLTQGHGCVFKEIPMTI